MDRVKFYRRLGKVSKCSLLISIVALFLVVLSGTYLPDSGKMAIVAFANKHICYYRSADIVTYEELLPIIYAGIFILIVISGFGIADAAENIPQYPQLYHNQESKFRASIFIMKFVIPIIVSTYGVFNYGIVAGIAISIVLFGLVILVLSAKV